MAVSAPRGWFGLPIGRCRPTVSVVRLSGMIGAGSTWHGGLTLASVSHLLDRAFAPRHQEAVALVINSPGGSPVQSSLIAGRIRTLAGRRGVPVLAFVEDVAASGGYWLAAAADEIFADASSIVGSIGVISAGFGFQELIARWGIERRLFTTGERKALLDPFRPVAEGDVARLMQLQGDIFASFREAVLERRGARLKAPESELFTGEFWTGRRALDLGLIDGLGDIDTILRQRFGERVAVRVVRGERSWWRRRVGLPLGREAADGRALGDRGIGAVTGAVAGAVVDYLEERAAYARFGL